MLVKNSDPPSDSLTAWEGELAVHLRVPSGVFGVKGSGVVSFTNQAQPDTPAILLRVMQG
jgi:hypothetical protein